MTRMAASPGFMDLALAEARAAEARGEVPIGAVVVLEAPSSAPAATGRASAAT